MYKIIGADGREYGPINLEQLRQWHAEGRANRQSRILVVGETNWKTLADLAEFSTAADTRPPVLQPIQPLPSPSTPGYSQRTNGFAVTGLILGIFSVVLAFCCCGGFPFNLLGLIFSGIGLAQTNRRPEVYTGKGAAIAGLIISGLSLLLGIAVMLLGVALNWHEIAREFNKF